MVTGRSPGFGGGVVALPGSGLVFGGTALGTTSAFGGTGTVTGGMATASALVLLLPQHHKKNPRTPKCWMLLP